MIDPLDATDFDFETDRLTQLASQQAWTLDSQLRVQFVKHAELNSFLSQKEGRKIFEDKVYVRILAPANRLNEIFRQATDEDRQRFARQFRAFLDNAEVLQIGTPLSELPTITPAQVLEMRHMKIDTVEQLAGLPDTTAQLMGTGGAELKRRAQSFLDQRAKGDELGQKVRDLQEQLNAALSQIQALAGQNGPVVVEHKVGEKIPATSTSTED